LNFGVHEQQRASRANVSLLGHWWVGAGGKSYEPVGSGQSESLSFFAQIWLGLWASWNYLHLLGNIIGPDRLCDGVNKPSE